MQLATWMEAAGNPHGSEAETALPSPNLVADETPKRIQNETAQHKRSAEDPFGPMCLFALVSNTPPKPTAASPQGQLKMTPSVLFVHGHKTYS